jgi:hypothetical protein
LILKAWLPRQLHRSLSNGLRNGKRSTDAASNIDFTLKRYKGRSMIGPAEGRSTLDRRETDFGAGAGLTRWRREMMTS